LSWGAAYFVVRVISDPSRSQRWNLPYGDPAVPLQQKSGVFVYRNMTPNSDALKQLPCTFRHVGATPGRDHMACTSVNPPSLEFLKSLDDGRRLVRRGRRGGRPTVALRHRESRTVCGRRRAVEIVTRGFDKAPGRALSAVGGKLVTHEVLDEPPCCLLTISGSWIGSQKSRLQRVATAARRLPRNGAQRFNADHRLRRGTTDHWYWEVFEKVRQASACLPGRGTSGAVNFSGVLL